MLLYCKKCGKKMPPELDTCSYCGSPRVDGPDELLIDKPIPVKPKAGAARKPEVLEEAKKPAAKGGLDKLSALLGRKPAAAETAVKPARPSPLAALFSKGRKQAGEPVEAQEPAAEPLPGKASPLSALFRRKSGAAAPVSAAAEAPVAKPAGGLAALLGKARGAATIGSSAAPAKASAVIKPGKTSAASSVSAQPVAVKPASRLSALFGRRGVEAPAAAAPQQEKPAGLLDQLRALLRRG